MESAFVRSAGDPARLPLLISTRSPPDLHHCGRFHPPPPLSLHDNFNITKNMKAGWWWWGGSLWCIFGRRGGVWGGFGGIKCILSGVHHQPSQPRFRSQQIHPALCRRQSPPFFFFLFLALFLSLSVSLPLSLTLPPTSLSLTHSFLGLLTSAGLVCVPASWICASLRWRVEIISGLLPPLELFSAEENW